MWRQSRKIQTAERARLLPQGPPSRPTASHLLPTHLYKVLVGAEIEREVARQAGLRAPGIALPAHNDRK